MLHKKNKEAVKSASLFEFFLLGHICDEILPHNTFIIAYAIERYDFICLRIFIFYLIIAAARTGAPSAFIYFKGIAEKINSLLFIFSKFVRFSTITMPALKKIL